MLRVRMKMGLGAYASPRQDTDYTGAGGSQEFMGRSVTRGPVGLTSVYVQADLSRCLTC
jgi:hypothetical protein